MTAVQTTPEKGYQILARELQKAGPEAQKRIQAHLRAVMGRHTLLPVYHNDASISNDDKVAFYSVCVRALLSRNYSILKGQEAFASAPASAGEDKRIDPADAIRPEPEAQREPQPEPEPPAPTIVVEPPKPPAAPEPPRIVMPGVDRMSPIARAIFDEIAPFLPKAEDKPLDTEAVRKIADEVFAHNINNGGLPVDRIKALIEGALEGHATPIEFLSADGTLKPIEGLMHPQVTQIVTWMRAVGCCWVWGGAGSGKTHMARQIAAMLEVDPPPP